MKIVTWIAIATRNIVTGIVIESTRKIVARIVARIVKSTMKIVALIVIESTMSLRKIMLIVALIGTDFLSDRKSLSPRILVGAICNHWPGVIICRSSETASECKTKQCIREQHPRHCVGMNALDI